LLPVQPRITKVRQVSSNVATVMPEIGFDEEPIFGNQTNQIAVTPFLERYDSAEGDVPSRIDRELRESVRSSVAVKHAHNSGSVCFANHGASIVLGIAGVNYDGAACLGRERDLRGKRGTLCFARRIIVVVVETAFTDCHSSFAKELAQPGYVSRHVE